jgi:hypothetical protein
MDELEYITWPFLLPCDSIVLGRRLDMYNDPEAEVTLYDISAMCWRRDKMKQDERHVETIKAAA